MKRYNLIVVGGGLSGTAAAIAAHRQGLEVLIVEQYNCLGGAPSNNLVNPYMKNSTIIGDTIYELSQGIFKEINENMMKLDNELGINNCHLHSKNIFNEEHLKLILSRMTEGIDKLFHAKLISACVNDGKIKSIDVLGLSEVITLEADYFIDASGNADLAYFAGCPFRLGRSGDGLCQPMTLCFRLSGVDKELFWKERDSINPLYKKLKQNGELSNPREDVLIFENVSDGCLHFNTTRIVKLNPTDTVDVTRAEIEAREQVFEIYEFLKKNFKSFKNSRVLSTAIEIGVRESRMIDGEHILTCDELKSCTMFYDSIALGNYDIDIHNPEGSGTSHYFFKPGEYYSIPFRSLVPKKISNMLVCGRCISATHEAQASVRIMPIVTTLGEAAGTAIGVCSKSSCDVTEVNVDTIRKILKQNGAIISKI